jgi:hypothetical protein
MAHRLAATANRLVAITNRDIAMTDREAVSSISHTAFSNRRTVFSNRRIAFSNPLAASTIPPAAMAVRRAAMTNRHTAITVWDARIPNWGAAAADGHAAVSEFISGITVFTPGRRSTRRELGAGVATTAVMEIVLAFREKVPRLRPFGIGSRRICGRLRRHSRSDHLHCLSRVLYQVQVPAVCPSRVTAAGSCACRNRWLSRILVDGPAHRHSRWIDGFHPSGSPSHVRSIRTVLHICCDVHAPRWPCRARVRILPDRVHQPRCIRRMVHTA